jgi:hypothetical protein
MVVQRIPSALWATFAIALAIDVAGCEGKSTSNGGDGDAGEDGNGGSSTGGKGGTTGLGGTTGVGGGSDGGVAGVTGGRGGTTSGQGGTTSGDAGQAGEAQGGSSGDAGGGGDAGLGGDAGGGPDDQTVRGRIIDFWRQPLSGVEVAIGTTSLTSTAGGEFEVPNVAPTYDVSLVVRWTGSQAGVYAWRFEGLTRRDPTLQVYRGRIGRSAGIQLAPQGAVLDASRVLSITLAGPHGSSRFTDVGATGINTSTSWVGPTSMQTSAHALLWEFDSNELPTAYRSYDSTSATLVESTNGNVFALNVADETVTSGTISGTVTSPSATDRTNYAFARFPDGAAIRVVEDYPPPDTYGYLVPTVPSSSITVAASYGYWPSEYSIAHRNGRAAGQSGVAIAIPAAAAQVAPVLGALNVGSTTQFSWSSAGRTVVFHVEDVDYYQGLYVVTNRQAITLPSFDSFVLRAGAPHYWLVETHGNTSSVDAFAGPQGGLDAFSYRLEEPDGPNTADGSYSASPRRGFTTAP